LPSSLKTILFPLTRKKISNPHSAANIPEMKLKEMEFFISQLLFPSDYNQVAGDSNLAFGG
jgi:preprotein translocase subunit SecB